MHNDGDLIYLRTNEDASNYKVVTINFAAPAERPKDFIAEDKHAFLEDVAPINGGKFVVVYKRDVRIIRI
jgi:protease II